MEFKQVAETGTLKQIGKQQQSSLRIREVADHCKLLKTDSGLKVECTYTGSGASAYIHYVDNHREELTKYLMNPDIADLYDWMEESHQTPESLKKHEKELLILYVNFDPTTKIMETGISDDSVTMKLGAPLVRINLTDLSRDAFKLKIYNMLLLADEIARAMGNQELRQMSDIQMVKTYLAEIYDKYHEEDTTPAYDRIPS